MRCKLWLACFLPCLLFFIIFHDTSVFADETSDRYITNAHVKFRVGPSSEMDIITLLPNGTSVDKLTIEDGWSRVVYSNIEGYIKSEYIEPDLSVEESPSIELLTWSEAKKYMSVGVDAEIYDIRSGRTYYVRSFSNGNHADIEPVTKEDTQIMKQTYNGRWSWNTRPVWVTINGKTIAASISGMPHGGGVNSHNGMNGQICLHFKDSTTHNGNRSHEREHQTTVMEAWNAR